MNDLTVGRDPALTGLRAVAALAVVGTHAAFATGFLTHGYVGALAARLDIGVAFFFVLSGFLLFRPGCAPPPTAHRPRRCGATARHRMRRVLPAYVVTVVATFEIYTVFTPGPNPGQTLYGLLRYLTFTQIYTDDYLSTLSASRSVPDVEHGRRGVVLPRTAGTGLRGAAADAGVRRASWPGSRRSRR